MCFKEVRADRYMGGGEAPQKLLLSAVKWASIGESFLITFILPMMSWCSFLMRICWCLRHVVISGVMTRCVITPLILTSLTNVSKLFAYVQVPVFATVYLELLLQLPLYPVGHMN